MNNAVKWLLFAGAGYLVYKYLTEQGFIGGGAAIPAGGDEGAGGEAGGETGGGGAAAGTMKQQVFDRAKGAMGADWSGKLNADQWNHYYSAVSGVTQTADLFPPEDRGALMDVDEYFSRRSDAGLSGMGGLNGRLSPLLWMT
jgi:hypothetical protein